MKTIEVKCDNCKSLITSKGISVQGNVYISGSVNEGLIGTAYNDNISFKDIECVDLCAFCFLKAMHSEFVNEIISIIESKKKIE